MTDFVDLDALSDAELMHLAYEAHNRVSARLAGETVSVERKRELGKMSQRFAHAYLRTYGPGYVNAVAPKVLPQLTNMFLRDRPEFIVSRDSRNATLVWPDGWAQELTQALVTAAKALPAPVTNVTVNDEATPQEVSFQRDPQGRIAGALIEPVD